MIGGLFFSSEIEFINSLLLAFTHQIVAQSKHNVFPVPVGDSKAAIDLFSKASITNISLRIYLLSYSSVDSRKEGKESIFLYRGLLS